MEQAKVVALVAALLIGCASPSITIETAPKNEEPAPAQPDAGSDPSVVTSHASQEDAGPEDAGADSSSPTLSEETLNYCRAAWLTLRSLRQDACHVDIGKPSASTCTAACTQYTSGQCTSDVMDEFTAWQADAGSTSICTTLPARCAPCIKL